MYNYVYLVEIVVLNLVDKGVKKMDEINALLSALIQLIVFSVIPLIWWFISGRKDESFFSWIGLKKVTIEDYRTYTIGIIVMLMLSLVSVFVVFPAIVHVSDNATSQFAGKGMSVIIPVLIFAIIKTGLSEEIFFRGFLGKRLISKFGFKLGNLIQALIFGLLHGVLFFWITGVFGALVIIILTSISGWASGWINEKQSGGSIVSSWMLHGLGNLIASFAAMFNFI